MTVAYKELSLARQNSKTLRDYAHLISLNLSGFGEVGCGGSYTAGEKIDQGLLGFGNNSHTNHFGLDSFYRKDY